MKMTPQCNPVLHYTKQPLLPQNNQVVVLNSSTTKKLQKTERKKRKNRIKCVIVGDKQVGKTSLAVSYSNDSFPNEYVPTAYDNYNVDVLVDDEPVRLEICDTAGEELGASLRRLCYPGTDVFMLCFSVVRPSSFESACKRWADELTRLGAPVVLVGCQSDLLNDFEVISNLSRQHQKTVATARAQELARRLNATYVVTSAKTCNNLKEAFDEAITSALKRRHRHKKWWLKLCCWKR
ncbi:cell division control protein 42 homolog [Sitophilus oryzae]|uniref:Cell division control protein 42 homolog n=1 Tax=Sitophilus oryzae TaxID=7048 RepID=A0A6J2XF83_SITOR|nr:cell division control protein 42 homolog [Sitophilus oryzae]